jgi:hypothetical protein
MRNKTKRLRRRYKKRTHKKRSYKKRGGVQPTERRETNLPIQNNNQPQQQPQPQPQNRDDNWRPPRLNPQDLGLNEEINDED